MSPPGSPLPAQLVALRTLLPEALVGVGTVRTPEHIRAAGEAGAQFAVSQIFSPLPDVAMMPTGGVTWRPPRTISRPVPLRWGSAAPCWAASCSTGTSPVCQVGLSS